MWGWALKIWFTFPNMLHIKLVWVIIREIERIVVWKDSTIVEKSATDPEDPHPYREGELDIATNACSHCRDSSRRPLSTSLTSPHHPSARRRRRHPARLYLDWMPQPTIRAPQMRWPTYTRPIPAVPCSGHGHRHAATHFCMYSPFVTSPSLSSSKSSSPPLSVLSYTGLFFMFSFCLFKLCMYFRSCNYNFKTIKFISKTSHDVLTEKHREIYVRGAIELEKILREIPGGHSSLGLGEFAKTCSVASCLNTRWGGVQITFPIRVWVLRVRRCFPFNWIALTWPWVSDHPFSWLKTVAPDSLPVDKPHILPCYSIQMMFKKHVLRTVNFFLDKIDKGLLHPVHHFYLRCRFLQDHVQRLWPCLGCVWSCSTDYSSLYIYIGTSSILTNIDHQI